MHSFHVEIAREHGIKMAIVITKIGEVINKLEKDRTIGYMKDGNDIYIRPKHMFDSFSYFRQRQVQAIINRCIVKGLLVKKEFPRAGFDNTIWFTLSHKSWDYLTS